MFTKYVLKWTLKKGILLSIWKTILGVELFVNFILCIELKMMVAEFIAWIVLSVTQVFWEGGLFS